MARTSSAFSVRIDFLRRLSSFFRFGSHDMGDSSTSREHGTFGRESQSYWVFPYATLFNLVIKHRTSCSPACFIVAVTFTIHIIPINVNLYSLISSFKVFKNSTLFLLGLLKGFLPSLICVPPRSSLPFAASFFCIRSVSCSVALNVPWWLIVLTDSQEAQNEQWSNEKNSLMFSYLKSFDNALWELAKEALKLIKSILILQWSQWFPRGNKVRRASSCFGLN